MQKFNELIEMYGSRILEDGNFSELMKKEGRNIM